MGTFLLQPGNVVGFDTEWRPTMCRAGTDERLVIIICLFAYPIQILMHFTSVYIHEALHIAVIKKGTNQWKLFSPSNIKCIG